MNLLLDVGNTRAKWAFEDGGAILRSGAVREAIASACDAGLWREELAAGQIFERVLVSSVLDAQRNAELLSFLAARFQCVPELVKVQKKFLGLTVAYDDVGALGVDRWLAMLGAWRQFACACVVLDAGSALTVDRVSSSGEHLGGLIVPGVTLMQRSLFTRTAAVKVPRLSVPSPWQMGSDTRACVENGLSALLTGLLAEVAGANQPPQKVILTGGDASILQSVHHGPAQVCPNLVLEGLICLL